MSRIACLVALVLAIATALATPVLAFNARNGMTVTDLGGGKFLVEFRSRLNETDFWCAAGDYAERVLRAPAKTRLYRVTPPPRKRGQGIIFSLNPALSGGSTGVSSFGAGSDKDSLSVGHVTGNFCYRYRPLEDFF